MKLHPAVHWTDSDLQQQQAKNQTNVGLCHNVHVHNNGVVKTFLARHGIYFSRIKSPTGQ